MDHKDEPPTSVIDPATYLPALSPSLSYPDTPAKTSLSPGRLPESACPITHMIGTVIHIEQTDIRTPTSITRPSQRPENPLGPFYGATIVTQAYNQPYGQPPTRPPTHPSIHPFRGLKWRSSLGTPRERTRPLDPIYPTISDRRKRPRPSSTTGRRQGPARLLASTSQQSCRHTSLQPWPLDPVVQCSAVQRRAARHEVLLVPLTDRQTGQPESYLALYIYCLSPCRHCSYCRRAGPLAYSEPGLVENPSLREFNNNQSTRSLTRRYVHYFHTLTTVCERCIHTFPSRASAPGRGAPGPFPCWTSNQLEPISPARPVAAHSSPGGLCSVSFKTHAQSVWPVRHEPAHCIQPGPVKQDPAPDSLNHLVYFHSAPDPDLIPELLSPASLRLLEGTYSEEADTYESTWVPKYTKSSVFLSATLADRQIMAFVLW